MQYLLGQLRRAVERYSMIADGDKIAVGISGGKDSIALVSVLNAYRRFAPQKFDLIGVNIDLGFKTTSMREVDAIKEYFDNMGLELIIKKTDIAEIIFDLRKESNPCSLCSKMRRGALNTAAIEAGCNKLALGHHADDVIETLFMSFIQESRFSTFKPVSYMDRTGITLIRPFVFAEEKYLNGLCRRYDLPIVHNPCPADKHTRRQDMKELIEKLDSDYDGAKKRMLSAIYHPERNSLWDVDTTSKQ